MNKNTIQFGNILIEVPKINKDQYMMLRYILMTIEDNKMQDNSYFIDTNVFNYLTTDKLKKLLKTNLEITVINNNKGSWTNFYIINDICLKNNKIFFRPANILRDIVLKSNSSKNLNYLKYILFNGIKNKQTLIFLDYVLKMDEYSFDITVDNLKRILELTKGEYPNFSTFRKSIIEKAIGEINEKTSITVEYTIKKKERKRVVELSFNYYTKEHYAL